ncbi:transcriptional regulator, LysR family protein [Erythrobacter sp. NAP1]|uniref:LysR family transcriptional regulator n=1 Tax=Erythrobacter sp. NAP1 TaxID=237727 RepID=UPI0000686C26|nr:LysR family transcriptional regulator [Erythrobacter sp. NAP1]EAQ30633.1 transcriptional regulator, LysR family protein [Erythrobacter sp. NAP1]
MKLGDPSLDQLRIFLEVVDAGSFGGAARRMNRAVSAISYGIAQLEAQLAVTLFEREGSRKPVLTPAGEGLLAEARGVADGIDALLAKTRSLHAGLESNLGLVLDVMVPGDDTAGVLRDFRETFPTVALRLRVEGLGAVASCLIDEEGQLAIGGPIVGEDPLLERQAIGEVELIPVAAPSHPLAQKGVQPGESRKHLQLVLSDRSSRTEGREFSVISPLTWRLGDLAAKHSLLKEGLGWGNMPREMVADDLAAGRLVELDLPEKPGDNYTLYALWRRDTRLGPATSWLIDAFRERLGA